MSTVRVVLICCAAQLLILFVLYTFFADLSFEETLGLAKATFSNLCIDFSLQESDFRGPQLNLSHDKGVGFDWHTVNYELDSITITIVVPSGPLRDNPYYTGAGDWRLLPRGVTSRSADQIRESYQFLKDSLAYQDSIISETGKPGEYPAERGLK